MYEDRIAYANGEFISLDDFDTEIQSRNNKIAQLQCELDKTHNQLMEVEKDAQEKIAELEDKINNLRTRCHKSAIDSFENGNYAGLFIVTADELKTSNSNIDSETDRLVKLPFDAMETANMLINATYRRKANGIDRFRGCEEDTIETDMYSVNDLEQIAEHLLVYCNHHIEEQD